MKRIITTLITIVVLSLPGLATASSWTIDQDHSNVGFKVKHLMVSNVKGEFRSFNGTIDIDDKDVTRSKVVVNIETPSITTGVTKRDDHLKSPDFFDVAKFPVMTFVSKRVQKAGNDKLKIYGDLTLHGVTKEVALDVEGPTKAYKDPWGNIKRGVSATARINRKDYGLTWNKAIESGGVVVGDDVAISLEVELLQK